jgi:hypothetical protein
MTHKDAKMTVVWIVKVNLKATLLNKKFLECAKRLFVWSFKKGIILFFGFSAKLSNKHLQYLLELAILSFLFEFPSLSVCSFFSFPYFLAIPIFLKRFISPIFFQLFLLFFGPRLLYVYQSNNLTNILNLLVSVYPIL